MGQRSRHFCALMKKNYIIWKRTILASMCELFCPVLLMSVLVIARTLITPDLHPSKSHFDQAVFLAPLPSTNIIPNNMDLMINQTQLGLGMLYQNFSRFSNVNLSDNNPITNFVPYHCTKKSDSPATPIIAYSGNESYT